MIDKILYCYAPDTRRQDQLETRDFLRNSKFHNLVEAVDVSKDLKSYPLTLLDNIGKSSFINIEMDIVPTDEILQEMSSCDHPVCVAQYINNITYNFSKERLDELVKSYCKAIGINKEILSEKELLSIEEIFINNKIFSPLILHRRLNTLNVEMDFSGNYMSKPFNEILKTKNNDLNTTPLSWIDLNDDYCDVFALGIIKFDKSVIVEEPDLTMMKDVSDWHHFDGTLSKYFLKKGIKTHVHKYFVKHNHYYLSDGDNDITVDTNRKC